MSDADRPYELRASVQLPGLWARSTPTRRAIAQANYVPRVDVAGQPRISIGLSVRKSASPLKLRGIQPINVTKP
jgi:hypothetical protein